MLTGFADKETERLWRRAPSRTLPQDLQRNALRKLALVHFAETLDDLKIPPGNKLKKLAGDREGQHSIRVNDQYRVCFRWEADGAYDVELTDYH